MKKFSILIMLSFATFSYADQLMGPPHLDLEMSSDEYHAHLLKFQSSNKINASELDDPVISSTIKLGTRLSKWIATINEFRSPENAIRITSATTRIGIPIDKPNTYSPSIIQEKLNLALAKTPEEVKAILLSNTELPSTIPVEDQAFINAARLIDHQYQSAARFKSLNPWKIQYIARAKEDVRGYHFLTTKNIKAQDLADVQNLPDVKLEDLKSALINICFNSASKTKEACKTLLEKALKENALSAFYNSYIKNSKKIWDNFFTIPKSGIRNDIDWSETVTNVPFNTPTIPKFIPYLQNNIEDEFRWNGWGLKMNFGTYSDGPVLIFKPGVVPHVNELGGNQIVMDSNQSIEEYESKWTIRHEFGHVLGLPDCYHEFYDTDRKAFVNYQLDTTDLMCSRAGNMNERIYKELEKAYKQ